jgi:DNA mismatch repair protein MSH3
MAIASSVFQFIIQQIGCRALFITHYPLIAEDAERSFPLQIENMHMKFLQAEEMDRRLSVHFLYTLAPGIASGSFGVECARLAGLPEKVLQSAAKQSNALQVVIDKRIKTAR